MEQSHYLTLLKAEFAKRQRNNPQFSLRSFARFLDVHPGTLNNVFNEKRSLSFPMAKRISQALCLSPAAESEFLKSVTKKKKRLKDIGAIALPTYEKCLVDESNFNVLAKWEHYALLSLMNTDDFEHDPIWMAKRLGLSTIAVEAALMNLQKAGLIVFLDGKYVRQFNKIRSTEDIKSKALRASHKETLDIAGQKLESVDVSNRGYFCDTMTCDPKKVPEIKQLIREFKRKLAVYAEEGERTEVYNLAIQFFPLTELDGGKDV